MKQKFRKEFFLYNVLFTIMFLMLWGNKITARADYYFKLENNVLTTTSEDREAVQQWMQIDNFSFPLDLSTSKYLNMGFLFYYATDSEVVHIDIRGNNYFSGLDVYDLYKDRVIVFSGDGTLTYPNPEEAHLYFLGNCQINDVTLNLPNIDGSHITINSGAVSCVSIKSKSDLTINGGCITCRDDIATYSSGNITINDGIVSCSGLYSDKSILINGGTITLTSARIQAETAIHFSDKMRTSIPISIQQFATLNIADENGKSFPSETTLIISDQDLSSIENTINANEISNETISTFRYQTEYVDPGYELTEKVPTINVDDTKTTYELVSKGDFSEFKDLYLDGNKLTRNIDYTAVAGSTRITIQAQTLALNPLQYGQQHSLMLEFRTAETNELRTASQLFTVTNNAIEAEKLATNQPVQETTVTAPVVTTSSNILYGTLLEDGRYLVGNGDNLSRIAREYLESEKNWKKIYQLNTDIIKDPNLIYIGQIFKLH